MGILRREKRYSSWEAVLESPVKESRGPIPLRAKSHGLSGRSEQDSSEGKAQQRRAPSATFSEGFPRSLMFAPSLKRALSTPEKVILRGGLFSLF